MEEELAETEAELGEGKRGGKARKADAATDGDAPSPSEESLSPVLVETFVITFLAEWGDRSQIATIGLAASSDPYGVTLGGIRGTPCAPALPSSGEAPRRRRVRARGGHHGRRALRALRATRARLGGGKSER